MVQGTLLVTGVSASKSGPDSSGQQSVTITGVINGPNVNEHVVYQQLFVDAGGAPTMGQLIPVVYAPNNPDKWFFAPSVEQQSRAARVTASAVLVATSWLVSVAPAQADPMCNPGGPPDGRPPAPSAAAPSGSAPTGSSE